MPIVAAEVVQDTWPAVLHGVSRLEGKILRALKRPALRRPSPALSLQPEVMLGLAGYDGSNFAVKSAPQMITIMNMVRALDG